MKEYMLLFWNESGDYAYQLDSEEMKQGMDAWQAWIGRIASQGKLISTKPIQWEGATVGHQGIEQRPAIKEKQMVTGYMLCRAESREEVEGWAADCPILRSAQGFTEIREVAPFEM